MKTYGRYIIKKILIAILVIFVISIFVFLLMHLIPGDPVKLMMGGESDPAAVEAYREKLHLNDPILSLIHI